MCEIKQEKTTVKFEEMYMYDWTQAICHQQGSLKQ